MAIVRISAITYKYFTMPCTISLGINYFLSHCDRKDVTEKEMSWLSAIDGCILFMHLPKRWEIL